MDAIRPGGRVMLFASTQHGEAPFDPAAVCMDEKTLMGSYSSSVTINDEVARLVFEGLSRRQLRPDAADLAPVPAGGCGCGDRPGVAPAGRVDEDRDQAVTADAAQRHIDGRCEPWNDSGGRKVPREETMKTICTMWVAVSVLIMAGAWPSAQGQDSQPNPSAGTTTKQFVAPARLIKRTDPIYPLEARQRVVQGAVVMKATIAANGTVKNIKVASGDPILRNAARDAVTQWRYEPARVEGVAFAVDTTITLNFSMGVTLKQSLFDLTQTQTGADGVEVSAPAPLLAPPAGVMRVSGRVMAGQLEKKVDPVYPADAIALDARGDVVLLATITKTGEVGDVQAVSGPYRFRDAAISAVKQWLYRPYEVDGAAVEVQATITVNFAPPQAGAAR